MIMERAAICHNVRTCLGRVKTLTELILDLTAIYAVGATTTRAPHVTDSRTKLLRVRRQQGGATGVVQYTLKITNMKST